MRVLYKKNEDVWYWQVESDKDQAKREEETKAQDYNPDFQHEAGKKIYWNKISM